MINPRELITSKQLMAFIIATQVGFGILILPATLAEKVGHDGWITVLFTGLVFTLLITGLVLFLKRFKNKSILEINRIVYGKYIGAFLNSIYILYCYIGGAITLRLFIYVIKISILKQTPNWAIELLIIIPAMYICWHGLKIVCRFANIIFFIIPLPLAIFMILARDLKLEFLLPLNERGFLNTLTASHNAIISFLGAELIIFIYPYIKDKGKILKQILLANLCTTLFYSIVVAALTSFFGEHHLRYLLFAIFRSAASYRFPIIERMDLILLQLWIFAMYSVMLAYFYCAYSSIKRSFNLDKSLFFIIIFFISSVILGRVAKDFTMTMLFEEIHGYSGVGLIILSLFTYAISTFRKRSDCTNDVQKEI